MAYMAIYTYYKKSRLNEVICLFKNLLLHKNSAYMSIVKMTGGNWAVKLRHVQYWYYAIVNKKAI